MNLEEKRAVPFRLLHCLYEKTNGDTNTTIKLEELGQEFGLQKDIVMNAGDYLKNEGLIQYRAFGPIVSITHYGIREVERALQNPDYPTTYFPAFNIIHVNQMIGSNIQQGTISASQAIIVNQQLEDFKGLLNELEQAIQQLSLNAQHQKDVAAELATIRAQIESSKPKSIVLSESLSSLRSIIENAAGSILAYSIIEKMLKAISSLG